MSVIRITMVMFIFRFFYSYKLNFKNSENKQIENRENLDPRSQISDPRCGRPGPSAPRAQVAARKRERRL